MSAEDIAEKFPEQVTIGASGFTLSGYPKVIPKAFANRIANSKDSSKFSINLFTGASTGDELDGVLARTGKMKLRIPYQSHNDLRKLINQGKINFIDMHLSHVGKFIREKLFPPIDVALIEACDVTPDGRIYLTNSSGMTGTYLELAKDIYIELNEAHPLDMKGLHDMYLPHSYTGRPINIDHVDDRIGTPYVRVNPERIKGIVLTNLLDSTKGFKQPDDVSFKIANHILDFILYEVKQGSKFFILFF
jgi:acetyl-CoA hydrolase/succinyl-CoA:acetate CoA-transferase